MIIQQCRMARAALGWPIALLAQHSGVSARTVTKFEAGETVSPETTEALRRALSDAGAIFVEMSGRVGVLVKP